MPRAVRISSLLFLLLLVCSTGGKLHAQAPLNLVVDTIILPGHTFQKVSASACTDVWAIEGGTPRNVYRLNSSLTLFNQSPALQAKTNAAFSAVLCVDTNEAVLGTFNDFAFYWKNNTIYKIKKSDGLTDSTVNAVVGRTLGGLKPSDVGISTGTGSFRCLPNNYTTYSNTGSGLNLFKFLDFGNSTAAGIGNYTQSKVRQGAGDQITSNTSTGINSLAPDPKYRTINTATISNIADPTAGFPMVVAGSDTGLVFANSSGKSYYWSGKKINKVIKYGAQNILVGSDSLYVFNSLATPTTSKCSYPKNKYKVNDIDITPAGCIWLATDSGLVRLKDANCANFAPAFTATDTSLIYTKSCSVNFNLNCTGCVTTTHWDFGDNSSSTTTSTHPYTSSGTYTVTLIASNGTCTDTVSKTIHVLLCCDSSYFSYVTLPRQAAICGGSPKTLDAGSHPSCHFLWSTGDTTQIIHVTTPGKYWVETITPGGCKAADTVTVSAEPNPTVSFTGLSSTYCSNHPNVVLTGTPASGFYSGSGITGNTFHPSTAGAGSHAIVYTYTDTLGCSGSDTVTVLVKQAPVAGFTGLAPTLCADSIRYVLKGTPTGGVFSGKGIVSDTIFNPSIPGPGKDSIKYIYTAPNGCADSILEHVLIKPLPNVSLTGLASAYCYTHPVVPLTGTPTGGTFSGKGVTGSNFTPANAIGLDTIQYSYTDTNGCSSAGVQLAMVYTQPVVSVTGLTAICSGNTDMLVASGNGAYSWNTGATSDSLPVNPTTTTPYTVSVTNPCGTASQTYTVVVHPLPTLTMSHDTTIELGSSAVISVSGSTGYSWSPSGGLSCTACPRPTANPPETTMYCVTATDTNGCTKTGCVTVHVEHNCNIYLPNAFSPGRGGVNATLCVLGGCIEQVHLEIFDRWGEKVFDGTDQQACWDGTYKGEHLSSAVFVYKLDAVLYGGEHISKKGNISLIR